LDAIDGLQVTLDRLFTETDQMRCGSRHRGTSGVRQALSLMLEVARIALGSRADPHRTPQITC
jgi:hypothetical protein